MPCQSSILSHIYTQEGEKLEREAFSKSICISFYHVFFMKSLLNKTRLGEY